ncbi:Rieske (2Fe-2S) domain-containing protein [Striga hermonthica]|uniref:Rieske (2Fe-2S) domain-containing protein n=1 Tax=Striga hermonthica TaxID=68872 RepID=A0A9N7RMY0_STRHE|nr:Rieske (2Fe-2S) domain-containing protein [Striga hermonthica]
MEFTLCFPSADHLASTPQIGSLHFTQPLAMAVAAPKFSISGLSSTAPRRHKPEFAKPSSEFHPTPNRAGVRVVKCKAAYVSPPSSSSSAAAPAVGDKGKSWVPVVPLAALPKGERRVIIQDGETVLLLWYKDDVFAIENRSPAEGAYSEGLLNAKLTQDGCIVCPTTDSTFDLRTGDIKVWYPKNPVLRALTPPLRTLFVYPVKTDGENIYISINRSLQSDMSTEIVFSGKANPGVTASDVNVDEVKMIVDEDLGGFGFTGKNELINGKAAAIGFLLLLDFELLTGKGLLKGTGFLDFIYSISNALQ